MDLFGKQGEEAVERIKDLEGRIDSLESHLEAVDSALQDFVDNYSRYLEEELEFQEDEIMELRELVRENTDTESDVERLENRITEVSSRLKRQEEQIQGLLGSDLDKGLSEMIESVKRTRKVLQNNMKKIQEVENRINDLEAELYTEINNRDFDFEKKLDKKKYEERESTLEEEMKKLRASVHVLADELDKNDEIEVE